MMFRCQSTDYPSDGCRTYEEERHCEEGVEEYERIYGPPKVEHSSYDSENDTDEFVAIVGYDV